MSNPSSRLSTLPTHHRQSSIPASAAAGPSPALLARINDKKAELENLKQLQDLSHSLAQQMQALKDRLETLGTGVEAVATVMASWHNVLRAINMASARIPPPSADTQHTQPGVQYPILKDTSEAPPLPQTLVRIPVEEATAHEVSNGDDAGST